ncbi:arsenic resistance N-acetyltransferase ArsN2 [Kangiella aquimarina]|uniref:Arsenic resistance N-acetyltransferase ArsN2 n=1 Tax=Kangiella aquimarina TaxID=261965 RepID=A0ABZ0X5W6_9GAMM|nr:arsenic resistance N-acetyltransferase ArsN2 [Kangiella aquimarina]WQG85796.1 arsenic resistance N-acetyltransferase ArsN2 [Kangiella aquimarina]
MYKLSSGPVAYNPAVETLLKATQLPTDDLQDDEYINGIQLFTLELDEQTVGVVGLELHGESALVRSLAVAESERGQGLGVLLLKHAEAAAQILGVKELYLLTTTAADFFRKLGYEVADRTIAPPSIAQSKQFAGICPASATFMVKRLADSISA